MDILSETRLDLHQAAALEQVHPKTIGNWGRLGVYGVYLETVLSGRRIVTSTEALKRFHGRVNRVRAERSKAQAK